MAVGTLEDRCMTARRAWLTATAALTEHTDDCLSCLVEWLPGCDEGHALKAEDTRLSAEEWRETESATRMLGLVLLWMLAVGAGALVLAVLP